MPPKLTWTDAEEIAILLHGAHPDTDPLTVRFTELRQWVCDLAEFGDDPRRSSEGRLEAIQMAWHEECEDAVN